MDNTALNRFELNHEEFKRIRRIIAAGMTRDEIARLFLGLGALHFARAAGYDGPRGREALAVAWIINQFNSGAMPEAPLRGLQETADTPDQSDGVECDGCGGVSFFDGVLRWEKALKGEPINVHFDMRDMPKFEGYTDDQLMKLMQEVITKWREPAQQNLKFKFVTVAADADIEVGGRYLDGPGKVAGVAFQPREPLKDMAAAGRISGNIFIDNSERWALIGGVAKMLFVFLHEFGHALGFKHTNMINDVMYAFLRDNFSDVLSNNDIMQVLKGYVPIDDQQDGVPA